MRESKQIFEQHCIKRKKRNMQCEQSIVEPSVAIIRRQTEVVSGEARYDVTMVEYNEFS